MRTTGVVHGCSTSFGTEYYTQNVPQIAVNGGGICRGRRVSLPNGAERGRAHQETIEKGLMGPFWLTALHAAAAARGSCEIDDTSGAFPLANRQSVPGAIGFRL